MIMENLERYPEIKTGGHNVNNLGYADNTLFIAENNEDLQKLLDIIEEESREKGIELKSKKAKVVSGNNECSQINVFISRNKLKQRDQFKYFGT